MMGDRRRRFRGAAIRTLSRLAAIVTAGALALAPVATTAQENKGPKLLRDAEIEQLLRDYTRPILRIAGLEQQNIQVVIINDPSFNAFVADGHRIFVNYGALMQSQTPNQLIGVLAHETGHLAGGHLAKLREELARAQTGMIVAMLLGVGAMVAGARSNNPNNGIGSQRAAGRVAEHPARLPAPAGGKRRSRWRQVSQRHQAVRQGHVRYLQAIQR
jgi:predicted Zn-dependent protease